MSAKHPLADKEYIEPDMLLSETLLTYPVEPTRLDIFSRFLTPSGHSLKRHKAIETTEIMLQTISAGRGVGALPHWLIQDQNDELNLRYVRLGKEGLKKSLHLGFRRHDTSAKFVDAFVNMAQEIGNVGS